MPCQNAAVIFRARVQLHVTRQLGKKTQSNAKNILQINNHLTHQAESFDEFTENVPLVLSEDTLNSEIKLASVISMHPNLLGSFHYYNRLCLLFGLIFLGPGTE